jgi:putative transposase
LEDGVYTLEEKDVAVRLYVKYGLKATATIRELGYPSRTMLVRWYREWLGGGRRFVERPRGLYTPDQKRTAVDHYLTHGRCNALTRHELGYPRCYQKLADWVDELAPGERRATEPRSFTESQKAEAVEGLVLRAGSAREVAEAAGTTRSTLYKWEREMLGRERALADDGDGADAPGAPVRQEGPGRRTAPPEGLVTQRDIDALEARKAALEEELRRLELRRDVMQAAIGILGKGTGAGPANELTNREKTLLVNELRPKWRLCELLGELGMARSSYQYQQEALAAPDRDEEARELVRKAFDASDGAYGRRRIHDALAASGHVVGERRIARIMEEEGLVARGKVRPKRGYSSYIGEVSEHPGNVVRQDFGAGLPNFLWLTDVTQFSIPAGKLYLSPVLDCFDGAIVSWVTSTSPNAEMANSMLETALGTTTPEARAHLVIHSDCGCHYRWPGWIRICEEAGVMRSMSRKGCSPDNSRMEGFFGTMKTEMFYGRDWSGVTLDELRGRIDEYIERYNAERIKRSLGSMSPLQYRRSLGLAA